MKTIRIASSDADSRNGVMACEISSPWLRADEAAKYLGVSRAFFDAAASAANVRHGWKGRTKVYHVSDLDALCLGKAECDETQDSDRCGSSDS